jgi:carboxylesterase
MQTPTCEKNIMTINYEHYPYIKNPHLDGDPFILAGGRVGILLVHGFTATPAEVRPLAEQLNAKGYTVHAPLLPGHNTVPEEANKYSWKDWVTTVEAAYRELGTHCEEVFLGGESTGGLLSLYLGSYHPEISGLLLYAPALHLNLSRMDILKIHLAAPFIPYRKKTVVDDDLPWKGYMVNPLKGVIQLLRLQKATFPLLPAIRRPTLIVQGRLDSTVRADVPQIIADQIRAVVKEIHWMEKSHHCVALDHEIDQVAAITHQFITKVTN